MSCSLIAWSQGNLVTAGGSSPQVSLLCPLCIILWMMIADLRAHDLTGPNEMNHCKSVGVMQIQAVARKIPTMTLPKLLGAVNVALTSSAHMEYMLDWISAIFTAHGRVMRSQIAASEIQPSIRALQHSVAELHEGLTATCESNLFTLQYLSQSGQVVSSD